MALTVAESNAVFTLLRWLGAQEPGLDGHVVTHKEAGEALAVLGERAGQRLQLNVRPEPVVEAVERFGAVVTAARGAVPILDGLLPGTPMPAEGAVNDALDTLRWALHHSRAAG